MYPCWVLTITKSSLLDFSEVYPSRTNAKQDSLGYRIYAWENQKQHQPRPRLAPLLSTGLLKDKDSSLGFLFQGPSGVISEGLKALRKIDGLSFSPWISGFCCPSPKFTPPSSRQRRPPLAAKELTRLL